LRPVGDGLHANGPATRGAARAGLAQCAASRRICIGRQRPTRQGCDQRVVMYPRRQLSRCESERGSKIHGRAAAEAVAAARKAVVMTLRERRLSVMVGVLFGARLVMSGVQMKRSMGVAAYESERHQQDQAAQERGSLHLANTYL